MPLPTPKDESQEVFADRCMVDGVMNNEYPDSEQRFAVCMSQYKAKEADSEKKLNKPFRTPDGPGKFAVYVRNAKDNVVKVTFGDSSMEIKRDDKNARKSFRARHKCDTNPGPKWKAKYWSCRMWEEGKSVSDVLAYDYKKEYKTYMAKKGYQTGDIVHAISTMLPGDELPEDIQYLPPGTHNITATKNGKPAELTVAVGAETAELLQNSFASITAGDKEQVFIDFNHDDSEASGWITGFYWAGADPEAGGVRAKVEWTKAGEEALQGRNFRKFSPTFTLNSKGEIEGTTLNAGGLVNRPAFKDITPIVASDGGYQNPDSKMADITDEDKKNQEASGQDDSKKKDEVSAEDKLAEVKKENETLKAKIKALENDKEKEQEVAAQAAVTKATEDGRIPPKDEDVKAKWVSILNHDPSAIMALEALPVNPAFQRVVQAKRQEDGEIGTNSEAQMRAAKEYQAKNGSSFEQAWDATRYDRPQLFN